MHADLIRGERDAVLTERGGADGALNQSDPLQVVMRVQVQSEVSKVTRATSLFNQQAAVTRFSRQQQRGSAAIA